MALKIRVHERLNEAFSPKTVKIGDQVWMEENLAVDDGGDGITYNEDNGEYYYTWDAAMRLANSISGWHLPTSLEWDEAALSCGSIEKMKPYTVYNPNYKDYKDAQELKDKLGVKLAGYYYGYFNYVDSSAHFWTSTEYNSISAYYRFFSTGSLMNSNDGSKGRGYSVRLVKD